MHYSQLLGEDLPQLQQLISANLATINYAKCLEIIC